ncbi:unnamed protein product [Gongylonema pulchrum]|uniref:Uncharacterized protein n=1 Tax=Gongylonema pulchrum TaxID=637853 RepID=A0A183DED9_9BILA|nr:unnamed protein product [Gongylonema pulchrum]
MSGVVLDTTVPRDAGDNLGARFAVLRVFLRFFSPGLPVIKLQEHGFAQPCNGMLPLSQVNDDDRRLASGAVVTQSEMQPVRSSPKAASISRRNRRKADLSLETSPRGDEDEITVPAYGTSQCNNS